jgi:hypothetical protein
VQQRATLFGRDDTVGVVITLSATTYAYPVRAIYTGEYLWLLRYWSLFGILRSVEIRPIKAQVGSGVCLGYWFILGLSALGKVGRTPDYIYTFLSLWDTYVLLGILISILDIYILWG